MSTQEHAGMAPEEAERAKRMILDRAAAKAEIEAMDLAYQALHRLGHAARQRAMRWLDSRLFGNQEEVPF